jgi:hypothetical protein
MLNYGGFNEKQFTSPCISFYGSFGLACPSIICLDRYLDSPVNKNALERKGEGGIINETLFWMVYLQMERYS